MRHHHKTASLAFGALLLTLSAQAEDAKNSAAEAEVLAAGDAWLAALDRGDADAMERMETDDFTFAQNGFLTGKAVQIDSVRAYPAPQVVPSRSVEVNSFSVEGDVAVMTGTRSIAMQGLTMSLTFTEVWVRADEDWLILAAHYSNGTGIAPAPVE